MEFDVEKMDSFTVVGNTLLRDKNISNKTRGLLCFMLSLPPEWDFSLNGLVHCLKEGKKAIMSQIKEARELGYMKIEKTRGIKGEFQYRYLVRQTPIFKETTENPSFPPVPQKGDAVKGDGVNGTQINTNKQYTNKQDKLDILDKSFLDDNIQEDIFSKLNSLTIQLIKRKFIRIDDLELFRFNTFLEQKLDECSDCRDYKKLVSVIGYVIAYMKNITYDSKFAYFKSSVIKNLNCLANREALDNSIEFYSEEYCSKLWDELNFHNNEDLTFDNSIFVDLLKLNEINSGG